MARRWIGGALLGACLGLSVPARAQFGPLPPSPPGHEPTPVAQSATGDTPYIMGPLKTKDVPPGPDGSMGLTPDVPNAFGGDYPCDYDKEVDCKFYADFALFDLKPRISHNIAYTATTTPNGDPVQPEFQFGYQIAPAFDVGYLWSCGWGFRAHAMFFHDGSNILSADNFAPPQPTAPLIGDPGAPPMVPPSTSVRSTAPLGLQIVSPSTGDLRKRTNFPVIPGEVEIFPIPSTLLAAGVGSDHFTFSSQVKIDVVDIEGTRVLDLDWWRLQLAAGVRYGYLFQSYTARRVNPLATPADPGFGPGRYFFPTLDADDAQGVEIENGDNFIQVDIDQSELVYSQTFWGAGPTFQAEGRIPLGSSGFSLYANGRASILIGKREERAFLTNSYVGTVVFRNPDADVPFPFNFQSARFSYLEFTRVANDRTDFMPIFDFEAGGSWELPNRAGVRPFIEAAFVGQSWLNAGNASSIHGDLTMLGGKITLGFEY